MHYIITDGNRPHGQQAGEVFNGLGQHCSAHGGGWVRRNAQQHY